MQAPVSPTPGSCGLSGHLWRAYLGLTAARGPSAGSPCEGGLEMQKFFCEELGLRQPAMTWHVARDGFAEAVTLLGLVTGTAAVQPGSSG
jgi:adenylosuccinate lyase